MIDAVVKQRARRGDLLDPVVLAESAQRNFDVYGFYGISVFADTAEQTGLIWLPRGSSKSSGSCCSPPRNWLGRVWS